MITKIMKYLITIILILGLMNILGCENKYESGKRYYFSSFASKIFPIKLYDELEYKYIEDHRLKYYIGIYNEKDNIVICEIWKLSREEVKIEKYLSKEAIRGLLDNLYPALYYSIKKEKSVEKPDKQIDIKAAEELLKYYRLTFDNEKQQIIQQKIIKEKLFIATYSYYANGKIKEYEVINSGVLEGYRFFYENGKIEEEKYIYSDGRVEHSLYDKKGGLIMDYKSDN